MPEDGKGGTSGDNADATKDDKKDVTFTQADLDNAVAAGSAKAAKEAKAESFRANQSAMDKMKAENAKTTAAMSELRAKQIAALPEEERTKAMIEDLYAKATVPTATEPDPDPVKTIGDPSPSIAETAEAAQKRMQEIAKAQGLDPEKLDFSSEDAFIKSIVSQGKVEDKEKEDPNGGPVDTGSHTVGKANRDLTKMKPADLIAQGRKNWKPIRGPLQTTK